jgi:hypothetical protein
VSTLARERSGDELRYNLDYRKAKTPIPVRNAIRGTGIFMAENQFPTLETEAEPEKAKKGRGA